MQIWIPVLATATAALIAAAVAIYQTRRNFKATKEIDQTRALIARKESELTEQRARKNAEEQRQEEERRQYQQTQVLPFLEGLSNLIDASYKVAHVSPTLRDIGGHLPHLRSYADKSLAEFMETFASVSKNRAQLFLALNESDLDIVATRLLEFSHSIGELLISRQKMWLQVSTQGELWKIQREVVRLGHLVMMDIHQAAIHPSEQSNTVDGPRRNEIAQKMIKTFEAFSSATAPSGSKQEFAWTALWEVNKKVDFENFIKYMGDGSNEDFSHEWEGLAGSIKEEDGVIDTKMGASRSKDTDTYWLFVKCASNNDLSYFVNDFLPSLRKSHPKLWSLFRSPIEITTGANLDLRDTVGSR